MNLKQMRRGKGWSQEQLADISGVSIRTIQRIEAGEAPGLETLKALAATFECALEDLTEQLGMAPLGDTDTGTQNDTDAQAEALIARYGWKGFLYNLVTMMVVVTWLHFITGDYESNPVIVGFVGFMWVFVLLAQAVTLLQKRSV